MDIYQILCLVGIPTLITLIITAIWNRAVVGTKQIQERKKKEQIDAIKNVVREETQPLAQDTYEIKQKLDCVGEGTKATLRNDLLEFQKKCKHKGYRTNNESEDFEKMLQAYHSLGGNSFIDNDVVPDFRSLSIKEVKETNNFSKKKQ